MDTELNLNATALELIEKGVYQDFSDYGIDPGSTFNGDRTILFPKNRKTRIIGDCYVMGIEDWVRESDLECGPCILLIQHAHELYFAGRFETVAVALKAIDPLNYRSQDDLRLYAEPKPEDIPF